MTKTGNNLRTLHISLSRALLLMTISLGLWSCGAMRSIQQTNTDNHTRLSKREFIARQSGKVLPPAIEASGTASINAKGKQGSVGVRMALTTDQSFELSARPLGFIEVARIMVDAQKGVLVIDRMNKRAFREGRVNYWSNKAKRTVGLNPMILRSMVQNEPFDTKDTGYETLKSMKMEYVNGRYHFSSSTSKAMIDHYFSAGGELEESIVSIPHKATITIKYADFSILSSGEAYRPYPQTILAEVITNGSKTYTFSIELNRATAIEIPKPTKDFNIPNGYQEVTVEELLKILKAL